MLLCPSTVTAASAHAEKGRKRRRFTGGSFQVGRSKLRSNGAIVATATRARGISVRNFQGCGRLAALRGASGLVAGRSLLVLFQDVEGVAMVVLHADGTEDGADGTRGAALFADHLAYVGRCDVEAQRGAIFFFYFFDLNVRGNVHQSAGNSGHKIAHVIGSLRRLHIAPHLSGR